jgi:hypothetical protein
VPRKTGKIQSNKTILLIVEGETEQIYFSEMKSVERIPGVTVIPRMASHSSVYHILKTALNEQSSLAYDSVWCVFDYDTILQDGTTPEVQEMMKEAQVHNIKFIDSLPSFELWYLLHYVLPKLYYPDQDAVIQELQKYISGYEKTVRWLEHARLYSLLKSLHRESMTNSESLAQRNVNNNESTFCNVYKIFEELKMES